MAAGIERLRDANPADAEHLARELAGTGLVDARERVARIAEGAHGATPVPRAGRKRPRLTLGILALAVAASFTPPVQALAERVGELVGIGDEPTRNATGPLDEPAVVIGAGESPSGAPYEVVASSDSNIYYDEDPRTCIGLDLPEVDGTSHAGCLTHDLKRSLESSAVFPVAFLGPSELGDDQLIVDGLARADVTRVEIERVTSDGIDSYATQLYQLDGALADAIGSDEQAAFFVTFLPEELVPPLDPHAPQGSPEFAQPAPAPGTIPGDSPVIGAGLDPDAQRRIDSPVERALARMSVVAYDAEGNEVGRESLLRGPFSHAMVYSRLTGWVHGATERDRISERCYIETLRRYGEIGEIEPQLPPEFSRDLGACLRDHYGSSPDGP